MSLHGNKTIIKRHHLPLSNLGRPAPSRNILRGISNRIAGNVWLWAHSQPQSHLKIQSLPASESSLSNAVSLHPSPPEPSPRKRERERLSSASQCCDVSDNVLSSGKACYFLPSYCEASLSLFPTPLNHTRSSVKLAVRSFIFGGALE